jgi:hypothetical protein
MSDQSKIPLQDIWNTLLKRGRDAAGRHFEILVTSADPEFGPFSDYVLVPEGEPNKTGYRRLTEEEMHVFLGDAEEFGYRKDD